MSHSGSFTETVFPVLLQKKRQTQSVCLWWVSVAVWLNLHESTRRAFWLLNVVYDVQCWGFSTYPWIEVRGRAGKRCNINPAPPGVSMATCPHCLLVLLVSDSCVELHWHLLVTWAGLVLTLTFSNISPGNICFIDHPKRKILSSFTHPYHVSPTYMTLFFQWNTKEASHLRISHLY